MTLWGGGGGWWQDRSLAWLSTGLVYLSRGETRKKRAPAQPSSTASITDGAWGRSLHCNTGNIDTGLPNRETILLSLWQEEDKENELAH